MRTYNPLKVKRHRSYTVEMLAECLDVNPNTVRQWIKHHGMPVIANTYPTLMHWQEIRDWITARQTARRWSLGPNEMSCLSCKAARKIKSDSLWIETSNTEKITLHGDCVGCSKPLNRFGVKRDLAKLEAIFKAKPQSD